MFSLQKVCFFLRKEWSLESPFVSSFWLQVNLALGRGSEVSFFLNAFWFSLERGSEVCGMRGRLAMAFRMLFGVFLAHWVSSHLCMASKHYH